MIKDASSESLDLIMRLLNKKTVQKITTFLTDKKLPHLRILWLGLIIILAFGA